LFNPNEQFSWISCHEQITFQWDDNNDDDDDGVHFELDQHSLLDFYNASSLMQVCR